MPDFNDQEPDESVFRGPDEGEPGSIGGSGDPGAWLPGLNAAERAAADRAERERDQTSGRELFGRYARSHQGGVPEGSRGGRNDDEDVVDAFLDASLNFELEDDQASAQERAILTKAIEKSQFKTLRKAFVDPNVATFVATVPNGGIKTNRDNHWVITLEVAWEDRSEVARILDSIPMNLLVTMTRPSD